MNLNNHDFPDPRPFRDRLADDDTINLTTATGAFRFSKKSGVDSLNKSLKIEGDEQTTPLFRETKSLPILFRAAIPCQLNLSLHKSLNRTLILLIF
jgi:hypothetical protein